MTTLIWNPNALEDREQIMGHIAEDSPVAAVMVDDDIEAKAELARQRPTLYRQGRVKGTREAVIPPNYILVYQHHEQDGILEMLRVLHARQQWPARKQGQQNRQKP